MLVATILASATGFVSSAVTGNYVFAIGSIVIAFGYGFYDAFASTTKTA